MLYKNLINLVLFQEVVNKLANFLNHLRDQRFYAGGLYLIPDLTLPLNVIPCYITLTMTDENKMLL